MLIEKGKKCLVLRISSPAGIDFIVEHKKIIDEKGYVWFCRFGNSYMKVEGVKECERFVFIKEAKDSGGRCFVAEFDDVKKDLPENDTFKCPNYYRDIHMNKTFWLRIKDIKEISVEKLFENFHCRSGSEVRSTLRSICSAFYVISENDVEF